MNNKFFVGNINQFGFGTWNAGSLFSLKAPRPNNKPNLFTKGFNQPANGNNNSFTSTTAPKINGLGNYAPRTPIQPRYNASMKSIPFSQSMSFPRRTNPYNSPDPMNDTNKKYFEPEMLKLQILENKIKDMELETQKNKNDLQDLAFNDALRNSYMANGFRAPSYNNPPPNDKNYFNMVQNGGYSPQQMPQQPVQILMNSPQQPPVKEYDPDDESNPFKPTREERRQQVKKELEKARKRLREDSEEEEEGEDEEGEEEEEEENQQTTNNNQKTEPSKNNMPMYQPVMQPINNQIPNNIKSSQQIQPRMRQPVYSRRNSNLSKSQASFNQATDNPFSNNYENIKQNPVINNPPPAIEDLPDEAYSRDYTKKIISPEEEAKIFKNSIANHIALKLQSDNFRARENMNILKANFKQIKSSLENQLDEMELRQKMNFENIKSILQNGGTQKLKQCTRKVFDEVVDEIDTNLVEENVPKFMDKIPELVQQKLEEEEKLRNKEKNEQLEEELRLIKEEQMRMRQEMENEKYDREIMRKEMENEKYLQQQEMDNMDQDMNEQNEQYEEEISPNQNNNIQQQEYKPKSSSLQNNFAQNEEDDEVENILPDALSKIEIPSPKSNLIDQIKYQSQKDDLEFEKQKKRMEKLPSEKEVQNTPHISPFASKRESKVNTFNTPISKKSKKSKQKVETIEKEKTPVIIKQKTPKVEYIPQEPNPFFNPVPYLKQYKNKDHAIFDNGHQEGLFLGNDVVNNINLFPDGLLGDMKGSNYLGY